jgi:hypothetical protein
VNNITFPLSYLDNGAIYRGYLYLHGAAPFKKPSTKEWHFQWPSRWRVRNSLMQIEFLTVKGPKFRTNCGLVVPSPDHGVLATLFPGKVFTRAIASLVNRFPMPYRAATKIVQSMPMPPRRRREGPSPQRQSGVTVLPRAAYPTVPKPDLHHRSSLPAGGSQQQRSIHHQARDTLQGDEGA